MTRALLLAAVGIFAAACATTIDPKHQASLDSWVGSPVTEFFAVHREPNSMIDMIDYRVYIWDSTNVITTSSTPQTYCTQGIDLGTGIPPQTYCSTYGGGAYTATYRCAWRLRVDDKVITEAEMLGGYCETEAFPKPKPELMRSRGDS